jgi:hypothetical protein
MASACVLAAALALLTTLATAGAVEPHSGNLNYLPPVPELPHLAKPGKTWVQSIWGSRHASRAEIRPPACSGAPAMVCDRKCVYAFLVHGIAEPIEAHLVHGRALGETGRKYRDPAKSAWEPRTTRSSAAVFAQVSLVVLVSIRRSLGPEVQQPIPCSFCKLPCLR